MNETVILELPEAVTGQAGAVAAMTRQQFEEVLTERTERSATELPAELLSDEQILARCDMQMPSEQQQVLSDLLARSREGELSETETREPDRLTQICPRGLVYTRPGPGRWRWSVA
ncbi:hypothetical protein [Desulfonema magnum]|uniref:Uncharacterized protein n=1 Tax=Desulfonema magnum TaxID=45655 RepID=A0A975GQB2_9BACT|nr:hypothetical protein [Desulfonema magnum]QTA89699.1 Uncharacterized protein dnm_057560 [Desulfonema magnum]